VSWPDGIDAFEEELDEHGRPTKLTRKLLQGTANQNFHDFKLSPAEQLNALRNQGATTAQTSTQEFTYKFHEQDGRSTGLIKERAERDTYFDQTTTTEYDARSFVSKVDIDRIGFLKAEEATAGLNGRE
jgi:hypothetical protein